MEAGVSGVSDLAGASNIMVSTVDYPLCNYM